MDWESRARRLAAVAGRSVADLELFANPPMPVMADWVHCGLLGNFRKAHQSSRREHWEQHGAELLRTACEHSAHALRAVLEIVDPREVGDGGRSLVILCTRFMPDLERFEVLLAAGMDLKEEYKRGDGVLHVLAKSLASGSWTIDGFEKAVELFCRHGANINQPDNDGQTPLEDLCHSLSRAEMVEDSKPSKHSDTAASQHGHRMRMRHKAIDTQEIKDKRSEQIVDCFLRNGARLPRLGRGSTSRFDEEKLLKRCTNLDQAWC